MPGLAEHAACRTPSAVWRFVLGPWAPVLIGVLCFLNALGNDFVRDDTYVVSQNPRIRSLLNWREIWLSNWWQITNDEPGIAPAEPDRLYRPLTMFSFAVNYAVSGPTPAGFLGVNLLLHAATAGLVWRLGRRLSGDDRVAALAALLFAAHPIHCEAVANVVGRADVLAGLFTTAGLLMLLPETGAPSVRRGIAAAGFFLLAVLSKESAACYVGLGAVLLVLRWWEFPETRRASWAASQATLILAPLAVYLPLRYAVLGSIATSGVTDVLVNPLIGTAGFERLVGVLTVAGHYARAVLFPLWLSSDYGLAVIDPSVGATGMTVLGGIAILGVTTALPGWFRPQGCWKRVAVVALLLTVSYALISNAVLLIGTSMGERLFYWPSAPALIAAALVAVALYDRLSAGASSAARVAIALAATAILLLGGRTVARNLDWRNGATLAKVDVSNWPRSAQLQAAQAWYVADGVARNPPRPDSPRDIENAQRALELASRHLHESLRICPGNSNAARILVEILIGRGDAPAAIDVLTKLLAQEPDDWHAHANLAMLLADRDPAAGLRHAREAYRLEPRSIQTRSNLASALADNGLFAEALEIAHLLNRDLPSDHQLRPQLAQMIAVLEHQLRPAGPP